MIVINVRQENICLRLVPVVHVRPAPMVIGYGEMVEMPLVICKQNVREENT